MLNKYTKKKEKIHQRQNVKYVIVFYFVLNKQLKNERDSPTPIIAHMLSATKGKRGQRILTEQLKSTHSCFVCAAHGVAPAAPGSAF